MTALKLGSKGEYVKQLQRFLGITADGDFGPKTEMAVMVYQKDNGLFVDFCVFTCFYQFLHDVIIKLFCFDLQNNFMITSCKNW